MDRRSFFASLGAVAAAPVIGCTGRDAPATASGGVAAQLVALRKFSIPSWPEDIEVALPFAPLRRKR